MEIQDKFQKLGNAIKEEKEFSWFPVKWKGNVYYLFLPNTKYFNEFLTVTTAEKIKELITLARGWYFFGYFYHDQKKPNECLDNPNFVKMTPVPKMFFPEFIKSLQNEIPYMKKIENQLKLPIRDAIVALVGYSSQDIYDYIVENNKTIIKKFKSAKMS